MVKNNKFNKDQFTAKCDAEIKSYFQSLDTAFCRSEKDSLFAARNFSMKVIEGVVFHYGNELSKSGLVLGSKVIELVGLNKIEVEEIRELGFLVYSRLIIDDVVPDVSNFSAKFYELLIDQINNGYSYVGPCSSFWFESEDLNLISPYVSVLNAETFLETIDFPKSGVNWTIKLDETFGETVEDDTFVTTIGGWCWYIKTDCTKDSVRQKARWMSDIFLSLIRFGIIPADYCHRAKIGQTEPTVESILLNKKPGIIFHSERFHYNSGYRECQYKVNQRFLDDFNSPEFQRKIEQIFNPNRNSIGSRISNGLGWLSRARQSADSSERLLYSFTALEALLSSNDSMMPVSDTIARYVSIIIAKNADERLHIYEDIKLFYNLRSELVHKGFRAAHKLDANNVQLFSEICFSYILDKVDLSKPHVDFLRSLKIASHGADWPHENLLSS